MRENEERSAGHNQDGFQNARHQAAADKNAKQGAEEWKQYPPLAMNAEAPANADAGQHQRHQKDDTLEPFIDENTDAEEGQNRHSERHYRTMDGARRRYAGADTIDVGMIQNSL
jgi:hypothetical protein